MKNRLTVLCNQPTNGNVLYISMRDQRIYNNHCIQYGYNLSYHFKSQFFIGIPLQDIKHNDIQYSLILENLEEMISDGKKYNLPITLLDNITDFISNNNITNIIIDWSPLKEYTSFYDKIKDMFKDKGVFCVVIDSHNVVPCKILDVYKRTSSSVKIQLFRYFFEYLDEYDTLEIEKSVDDKNFIDNNMKFIVNVWDKLEIHKFNKKINNKVKLKIPKYEKSKYFKSGYKAGVEVLETFFNDKFSMYSKNRNNPDIDGLSNVSVYIHLGILSPHKIIKMAYERFHKKDKDNLDGFIAEIFVWRETSEHFCMHNKDYDNINGALEWARNSLKEHESDKRDPLYDLSILEKAETEDTLWNAAQNQLLKYNKIHGYVRMYWAKQLVKWTKTPEEAIEIGIYLNDKYSIDGNDPNGYTGIMWSICGSMDRGYKDRQFTGKIRPMNKIKTHEYEKLWNDKEETKKYLNSKLVKRK